MIDLKETILGVTKPKIVLDKLAIADNETGAATDTAIKPSKFAGSFLPYIVINGLEISIDMLELLELNNTGFIPTARIRIADTSTMFMQRHFPKDGDVVSLLIRANNEKDFKPIRIDFDIVRVDPGYDAAALSAQRFTLMCQMKIPDIHSEECRAYPESSSYDTLLELSTALQLGFASNVENTADTMTWINPCDTRVKFINDTTANSYSNEDSFFKSYIDPYYSLNFINVNQLFSMNTHIEEGELYNLNPTDLAAIYDDDAGQTPSQVMLTNLVQYQGTSKYVSKYRMVNNAGAVHLRNGYKRFAQFYDIDENCKNGSFVSEFVDPFTTDGSDEMVHLKGRFVGAADNRQPEGIAENQEKFKYLGKQQVSPLGNVHDNFLYSSVLNFQNSEEILKMGMIIDLDSTDMTLYRYQRIHVFIYDYGHLEKKIYEKGEEEQGIEPEEPIDGAAQEPKLNKFLSGYYLISGITYLYTKVGPIRQRLNLIRREFNPST